MSIEVTAVVQNPERVELTVTATMNCAAWTEVMTALDAANIDRIEQWHAAAFLDGVRKAVKEVQRRALSFDYEPEKTPAKKLDA